MVTPSAEQEAEELYRIVLKEGGRYPWNDLVTEIMNGDRKEASKTNPFTYCNAADLLESRGIVKAEKDENDTMYIVIIA